MAAVDYFLKIDGIPGESKDAKHEGEIDVDSWSWGSTQSGSMAQGGGGGAGKVSMADFKFTMRVNQASPKLMLAHASGQHIPSAVLTCRKAGTEQQEYMKINFTDLIISSYQAGGNATASVMPVDQVAFNFSQIQFEYSPQQSDGTLGAASKVGWNVKKNQKV